MARVADLRAGKSTVPGAARGRRGLKIVAATPGDRPAIARLLQQVWLDTYIDTDRRITTQDISEHVRVLRQPLNAPTPEQLPDQNTRRWTAKRGGQVVGYCRVRQLADSGRLQVLHILPEYQGMGIGKLLIEQALSWLDESKPIYLKVVRYNDRAVGFYQKYGFQITRQFALRLRSGKLLPKYEMVKEPELDFQTRAQDR